MNRSEYVEQFYALLGSLRQRVGGFRYLKDCNGSMGWPRRGVYFFYECGEYREDGQTHRVVRVGTHALRRNSRTTLWKRLAQHRGTVRGAYPGGGNHRGSVFRRHIGNALLNTRNYDNIIQRTWGNRRNATGHVKCAEYLLECDVSSLIVCMPLLWVEIPDPPGPDSDRRIVEAGAVSLLSNYGRTPIDPPSIDWLGLQSASLDIRSSGLWNVNYVRDDYDPHFLSVLERYVKMM